MSVRMACMRVDIPALSIPDELCGVTRAALMRTFLLFHISKSFSLRLLFSIAICPSSSLP
jgi:hypothetical protein